MENTETLVDDSVQLTSKQYKKLKRVAQITGLSVEEIIQIANGRLSDAATVLAKEAILE